MRCLLPFTVLLIYTASFGQNSGILIEAESFSNKGGWVVDPQFVEQMGSPYLLAHGMGQPVDNAETPVVISKKGEYHIWVRTKNWVPGNWEPPGTFQLQIDDHLFDEKLGTVTGWDWQYAGHVGKNDASTPVYGHGVC